MTVAEPKEDLCPEEGTVEGQLAAMDEITKQFNPFKAMNDIQELIAFVESKPWLVKSLIPGWMGYANYLTIVRAIRDNWPKEMEWKYMANERPDVGAPVLLEYANATIAITRQFGARYSEGVIQWAYFQLPPELKPEPSEAEKAWESWKFAVKFADDKVEALTKCAYLAAWQEARESKSSSSS